jgi:AmiR/NasT family two-component response regulator
VLIGGFSQGSLTVLIAEDEALIAFGLAHQVEAAGYAVLGPCASMREVREVCSRTSPDLALIDVELGRDSGKDVCAYLSREFGTICVFVTAHPEFLIKNRAGALGSVQKPYRPEDIPSLLQYMATVRSRHPSRPPRFLHLFS